MKHVTEEISFDEFQKLDLRVGKIIEATQLPNSKKLIKIIVDFGSEKRQAVAGLLKYYQPEELVEKKMCFSAESSKAHVGRSRIAMHDFSG